MRAENWLNPATDKRFQHMFGSVMSKSPQLDKSLHVTFKV